MSPVRDRHGHSAFLSPLACLEFARPTQTHDGLPGSGSLECDCRCLSWPPRLTELWQRIPKGDRRPFFSPCTGSPSLSPEWATSAGSLSAACPTNSPRGPNCLAHLRTWRKVSARRRGPWTLFKPRYPQ
eukprot:390155-Rhodomonas_salina.1